MYLQIMVSDLKLNFKKFSFYKDIKKFCLKPSIFQFVPQNSPFCSI